MTKEDILNYFYKNSNNLGIKTILISMLLGLIIAIIIYSTYYFSSKKENYNHHFSLTLVVILLISIVIMLMISSNIVVSLGMVGALSIIRFRTAIKDSKDTIFLFWAITEGLCIGASNFKLALITTLFISVIILIINYISFKKYHYLLIITGKKYSIKLNDIYELLSQDKNSFQLKTANKSIDNQEYIFELITKKEINNSLIDKITKIKEVSSVNLIAESNYEIN